MSLAFARSISPDTPILLAAVLSGRRRPKQLPWGHVWLKIADRLAAGMPPEAAALPEGGDGRMVAELLAREEFQALVAAAEEQLAEPPESHRRRLVILARQAIERALALDDAGAALFVLEEEARQRDPCVTLADSVLRSRKRALASAAMPAAPPADAATRPGRYRYDPLRRMMHRGTARLRQDVVAEEALRHVALQAVAPAPEAGAPTGAAATQAAAERALALKREAATGAVPPPPDPPVVMLRHGLCLRNGVLEPFEPTPAAPASQPAGRARRSTSVA